MKMLIKKWKEFYEVRPQAQHIIFNSLATFMFHFSAPFLPMPSFTVTWKGLSSEITRVTHHRALRVKIYGLKIK